MLPPSPRRKGYSTSLRRRRQLHVESPEWAYIHQALQENETRLFKLAPAVSHNIPIKVELYPCSLCSTELPAFETVLYSRGDPEDKVEISCGGVMLIIPKNLYDALRYLRTTHNSRALWADTISINQSDKQEKKVQFALKEKINLRAARSNIWVEPHLPSNESALALLSKLQEVRNAVFVGSASPRSQEPPTFQQLENYRRGIPAPTLPGWNALEELLDAQLFTR